MPIRLAPSAERHGISAERARYVVEHCPAPLYSPEPAEEDLVIFLGPDAHGVPLEVMGIELADRDSSSSTRCDYVRSTATHLSG